MKLTTLDVAYLAFSLVLIAVIATIIYVAFPKNNTEKISIAIYIEEAIKRFILVFIFYLFLFTILELFNNYTPYHFLNYFPQLWSEVVQSFYSTVNRE